MLSQSGRQQIRQDEDAVALEGVRSWPKDVEACRKTVCRPLEERPPEPMGDPRRGDDVDIVYPDATAVESSGKRERRKVLRVLLAVEALLLQDESRDAIAEQGDAGVMAGCNDAENIHDDCRPRNDNTATAPAAVSCRSHATNIDGHARATACLLAQFWIRLNSLGRHGGTAFSALSTLWQRRCEAKD